MLRTPLKFALLAGFGLSLAGALYAPPATARTQVAVGETAELRLKVAESYTAEPVSVPVTVVRGGPGPTLFVTAK